MTSSVIVYHTFVNGDNPKDKEDVLSDTNFISGILNELGYSPIVRPFVSDLETIKSEIAGYNPEFIFNLVENIDTSDGLTHFPPSVFEHLGIPYTGCSGAAMFLTSNKLLAKKIFQLANIKTPHHLTLDNLDKNFVEGKKYLVKSVKEHASFCLEEDKIKLIIDKEELRKILDNYKKQGKEFFAEEYIEGREFTVALLGSPLQALPISEINFIDYPEDKLKIFGFRAKWVEDSFEYNNTKSTFNFGDEDKSLIKKLERMARKCWRLFGLTGYARVDFRVDKDGTPYVLEVNANPCISPDTRFIAAGEKVGLNSKEIIQRIVEDCVKQNE